MAPGTPGRLQEIIFRRKFEHSGPGGARTPQGGFRPHYWKEYFDKIDADLGRESEEENILGAVKRREDFAKMLLDRACAKIQAYVRMKQIRAEYLKAKSKKKGKKKGKK